ncbi:MAG: arginase family protein, partial [Gammaproteobacteria bacterium]|nr:arginase family protein [Gammaproteobacteria bacterium]
QPPQRPIYLTLDLDYFDPAYLPGTGTPEAGGEDFHSFIALNKILAQKNYVGADVVELAPELDSSGNSAIFAAVVVRETLLALGMGAEVAATIE